MHSVSAMRLALAALVGSAWLTACASDGASDDPPSPGRRVTGACVIGGCSSEICADQPMISPCIWRDDFACYADAACGRQADGSCGWSMTPELTSCLASHPR
jgi:hypothetical protein